MALWQGMADAYVAEHPNVTINITVLENEAFKTKLTTVMQSGEPPDVFQSWGGGVMNQYADAGLIQDITAALDENGGEWRNTFSAGPLGVYAYGDKNYGVPWDMGMVGFWYNKKLFADAGIDAPPETWAEFLEDVQKLKDAGITPIAVAGGDKWPAHFYWTYLATRIGGQDAFVKASTCPGSFTDDPYVEAGRKLQELIALEPFQDGFLGATYGDEAGLVGDSKAAMELMGQWAPAVQNDNSASGEGIGDDLGFFLFPAVEGGAGALTDGMGGGNGFAIGKNAPPEAVDFVKFLTSQENQIALAEINVGLPVVVGSEKGVSDPNLLLVQEARDKAVYFQLYYDQYLAPATGEVIKDAVMGLFANMLTPEEVAQQLQDSFAAESCK
ncbi:MAG: extracellular solute-binding protein [Anaerolineae bacterium]|nr:extracellular solute-binding protein [Anaerolineae bacterium]